MAGHRLGRYERRCQHRRVTPCVMDLSPRLTGQIGISRCLERSKSRSNDESGTAEATERLVQSGRPHAQGSDAIQNQTEDEDGLVAKVAEDPVCVTE